jgi:hypothetical protein
VRGATWKDQSKFTDPGAARAVIDELPADLAALREASSQLVFHYRGDGDWAENGVPAERAEEIDTRYADAMVFQLPPYASELNPVESVWSHLKRSLANLAKRDIAQLTALVKTRLRGMQYQPGLVEGFLTGTRLDLSPSVTSAIDDRVRSAPSRIVSRYRQARNIRKRQSSALLTLIKTARTLTFEQRIPARGTICPRSVGID